MQAKKYSLLNLLNLNFPFYCNFKFNLFALKMYFYSMDLNSLKICILIILMKFELNSYN